MPNYPQPLHATAQPLPPPPHHQRSQTTRSSALSLAAYSTALERCAHHSSRRNPSQTIWTAANSALTRPDQMDLQADIRGMILTRIADVTRLYLLPRSACQIILHS